MVSEIKITNKTECSVIEIEGVIGMPEKLQFRRPGQRVATYARFREALDEIATIESPEIVVNIRSSGGDVNDALLIYDALKGLKGNITTHCYGYVASAATIIAQAASTGRRELSSNTLYLVHCSETGVNGTARSMSQTHELLLKTDRRIAEIYALASNKEVSQFEALMAENDGKGRWLTAQEAIEAGLADVIVPTNDAMPRNSVSEQITALLGLPDLPANDSSKQSIWNRIVNYLRRVLAIEEVSSIPPVAVSKIAIDTETPQNATPNTPRGISAQLSARATAVRDTEDPSAFEWSRTQNEVAYESDIASIRN